LRFMLPRLAKLRRTWGTWLVLAHAQPIRK